MLYLDIETCPAPHAEALVQRRKPPANYKNEDTIAAWRAKELEKAAMDIDMARPAYIGVHADDSLDMAWIIDDISKEADCLREFWAHVRSTRASQIRDELCGFGLRRFDLPLLIRRSQILDVDYPHLDFARYTTRDIADLEESLTWHGTIPLRSLSFYGEVFGLGVEDEVTGADIPRLVAEGEWTAVATHCQADLRIIRGIARKIGLGTR